VVVMKWILRNRTAEIWWGVPDTRLKAVVGSVHSAGSAKLESTLMGEEARSARLTLVTEHVEPLVKWVSLNRPVLGNRGSAVDTNSAECVWELPAVGIWDGEAGVENRVRRQMISMIARPKEEGEELWMPKMSKENCVYGVTP
jgi:hypothetical protein